MKKKMKLFAGILTAVVFISFLLEIIGDAYDHDDFQISFKQIGSIFGWLVMSLSMFYLYFNDK